MADEITHPGWRAQLAVHAAVRRDIRRLSTALDLPPADVESEAIVTYWGALAAQLHHHHVTEDVEVWPYVHAIVGDEFASMAADIEAEHQAMADAMQRAETAMAGLDDSLESRRTAAVAASDLRAVVDAHLDHEEADGLPVMASAFDDEAMAAFFVRSQKYPMDPSAFLPWVLDDAPDGVRAHFVGALPDPVKAALVNDWQPARARMVSALSGAAG